MIVMKRSEELNTIIREVYSSYDVKYGSAIVDLIQRIEKAIEYIENHTLEYDDNIGEINIKELLDILKGSDSNE